MSPDPISLPSQERTIRPLGEFWVAYVACFLGMSYCFSLAAIPDLGFLIVTFFAFILTTCGMLCGQVLPRLWMWTAGAVVLTAGTLISLFLLFTVRSWVLLIPLIIPSICIGALSVKSRYVFFWGFVGALLPSTGLLGLVILDDWIRLRQW